VVTHVDRFGVRKCLGCCFSVCVAKGANRAFPAWCVGMIQAMWFMADVWAPSPYFSPSRGVAFRIRGVGVCVCALWYVRP
jgi:hypothetical protein